MNDEARLRAGVAFVWFATGALVLHPFYRHVGADYLQRLHVPTALMPLTCLAEVGLAAWVLVRPATGWITALQVGMVTTFTVLLAAVEPMMLASPFGFLTKNVPFVTCVVVAWMLAREGWTKRTEWTLRVGMAAIWLTEGLVPKILFQQPIELGIASWTGLSFSRPDVLLRVIGVAQATSGVLALVLPRRFLRWLLLAQIAGVVVLPCVVSLRMPLLWFHPFGPFTKNVPIAVGTWVLYRRCSSSS